MGLKLQMQENMKDKMRGMWLPLFLLKNKGKNEWENKRKKAGLYEGGAWVE